MNSRAIARLTTLLALLPLAGAFAATGDTVYAVGDGNGTGGTSELYRINNYATSPTAINVGNTGFLLTDLAMNRQSGLFYAISFTDLYSVNPSTGAATLIGGFGTTGTAADLNALEFDRSGNLYSWGNSDDYLYKINLSTGVATRIGNTGVASGGDLAWDNASGGLFGTTSSNQLVKINVSTGAATTIGAMSISGSAYGLVEDSSGTLYLGANQNNHTVQVYTVNQANAAVALVGSVSSDTEGLFGMTLAPVPEPGSALLVLCGLVQLVRRKRQRLAVPVFRR